MHLGNANLYRIMGKIQIWKTNFFIYLLSTFWVVITLFSDIGVAIFSII